MHLGYRWFVGVGLDQHVPHHSTLSKNRHGMRTSNAYDAVIDFDTVMRDPSHPTRLLPAYDSGDHLHPNDAGYRAMADSIDLSLFRDEDEQ